MLWVRNEPVNLDGVPLDRRGPYFSDDIMPITTVRISVLLVLIIFANLVLDRPSDTVQFVAQVGVLLGVWIIFDVIVTKFIYK